LPPEYSSIVFMPAASSRTLTYWNGTFLFA
jgi:hypothetical protein